MTAVAAEGFAALADRLQTIATGCAVAGSPARLTARLTALGRAYVDFALENRNLADLMFRQAGPQPAAAALAAAAEAAFAPLRAAVSALCGRPADACGSPGAAAVPPVLSAERSRRETAIGESNAASLA